MAKARPVEKKRKKDQSAGANVFHLYKQKGSAYYSMRIMIKGKRRRFSTGESSLRAAKAKAKVIMADIQSRGFDKAVRIHSKHRDEVPLDPTVAEFSALYRSFSSSFDRPASRPTRERYIRSLERIAKRASVGRVSQLNEQAVDLFKRRYMQDARDAGRNEESLRTSLNGILRNAAALFSGQALQCYRRAGLQVVNPFSGSQMKGIRLKSYSPLPRDLVDSIWKNAVKLRDGDKKADPPQEGLRPRDTFDFRVPNRDAYTLLLLELGLGLRRNEADKAEWSWFFDDAKGRRFIEVRETAFFLPKSKQSRVVPVEEALWKALQDVKSNERFVVDGPSPIPRIPEKELKSAVYRCDMAHRTLVAWLKKMGVDDPKPCHRLRKEFGSYVSTVFGLYHAQKFLGHSSPNVTAQYYAGLTELPSITPSKMAKTNERSRKKQKKQP